MCILITYFILDNLKQRCFYSQQSDQHHTVLFRIVSITETYSKHAFLSRHCNKLINKSTGRDSEHRLFALKILKMHVKLYLKQQFFFCKSVAKIYTKLYRTELQVSYAIPSLKVYEVTRVKIIWFAFKVFVFYKRLKPFGYWTDICSDHAIYDTTRKIAALSYFQRI